MSTKDSEKSIELYKIVLFLLIIIVVVIVVVNVKNKKRNEIYKTSADEVTQVSVSPNKTAKPIKIKYESTVDNKKNQEFDTEASVGESIRFRDFYVIPQEVNDQKIVFKFDSSSSLREYDQTSQLYVNKDLYTINKGETIRFSDGSINQDIYILTY